MKQLLTALVISLILATPAMAIDSEPILKGDLVAIDSEPILKVQSVAIDSEPILLDDPKAIDSEPILKEEFNEMNVVYKKGSVFIKVTYKPAKAEEVKKEKGEKMEKEGLVHRVKEQSK